MPRYMAGHGYDRYMISGPTLLLLAVPAAIIVFAAVVVGIIWAVVHSNKKR